MNSLTAFYLAEKMIRDGAPREDIEQVIVLLKDEISKILPQSITIVSPRSTIEVHNIVIEILAYMQKSFNKDYMPQMITLCMAYFRLDPEIVDFLLSFYSQPEVIEVVDHRRVRGRKKAQHSPE